MGNYMFKFNNINTRLSVLNRFKVDGKERLADAYIVNFEHIRLLN